MNVVRHNNVFVNSYIMESFTYPKQLSFDNLTDLGQTQFRRIYNKFLCRRRGVACCSRLFGFRFIFTAKNDIILNP